MPRTSLVKTQRDGKKISKGLTKYYTKNAGTKRNTGNLRSKSKSSK